MWRKWRPVNTGMAGETVGVNKALEWMDLHQATAFGSIRFRYDFFDVICWSKYLCLHESM